MRNQLAKSIETYRYRLIHALKCNIKSYSNANREENASQDWQKWLNLTTVMCSGVEEPRMHGANNIELTLGLIFCTNNLPWCG